MKKGPFRLIEVPERLTGNIRPFRLAALVAGVYLVFGITYIFVSSHIASVSVLSKAQLETVETYKGAAFIVITAILLFVMLAVLLQGLQRREEAVARQRDAIAAAAEQAVAGLFASSVAHDLNNILTVSFNAVERLLRSRALAEPERHLVDQLRYVNEQIRGFADNLSDVSGKHLSSGIRRLDLTALVGDSIKLSMTHNKVKRCRIDSDLQPHCMADIDAALLQRALLNLIVNAADATRGRGRIKVVLTRTSSDCRIDVHDNGPGIPETVRFRVLEPFYTTKDDGSGLGLLSVKHCAEIHNGRLEIESSPLGGTCFCMILPERQRISDAKKHHAGAGSRE